MIGRTELMVGSLSEVSLGTVRFGPDIVRLGSLGKPLPALGQRGLTSPYKGWSLTSRAKSVRVRPGSVKDKGSQFPSRNVLGTRVQRGRPAL